jgi:hypothetical protein
MRQELCSKQRRPDGIGGWTWKLSGVKRILYRLPELLAVSDILVVEGEIFREKNLMHAITEVKIPLRVAMPDSVQYVYGTSPKRTRKRTIK